MDTFTMVTSGELLVPRITHRSFQATENKRNIRTHAVNVKSVARNTHIVSFTSALMEVSDQRHASADLPMDKTSNIFV